MNAADFYEGTEFKGKHHKSRAILVDDELRLQAIGQVQEANPGARVHVKVQVLSWRNTERKYALLVNYTLRGVLEGMLIFGDYADASIELEARK